MVKIFKKKENKRDLTETQKQTLIKSSYELGFEGSTHFMSLQLNVIWESLSGKTMRLEGQKVPDPENVT
jgi:hypothetical protein